MTYKHEKLRERRAGEDNKQDRVRMRYGEEYVETCVVNC